MKYGFGYSEVSQDAFAFKANIQTTIDALTQVASVKTYQLNALNKAIKIAEGLALVVFSMRGYDWAMALPSLGMGTPRITLLGTTSQTAVLGK